MNLFLWILQSLLALHTVIGAAWKLTNTEEAVGSLKAIPHSVWMALSGIEVLCAIALVAPPLFSKKLAILTPIAALVIAAEMLLFSALHLASGEPNKSPITYWMIVAAVCAFIAFGRFVLKPFGATA